MSGPQVYWGLPPSDLFTFPPSNQPAALPPPIKERTFRAPFGISPWLFNLAMRPEVPAAFALSYIIAVFALNAWNRKRGHKPWWIARQPFFKPFVILHNVSLAIYSFATFVAMYRALRHTWPGFDNPNGLAGVADSLCKIHGPRGLGDAATYNTTINIWESKNAFVHMNPNGTPDHTDVGRLWNEGLAFWGWIFYLSKFYEVLDTFIIVAKGKRSATLQTYHHAGAMLCMWAGMRYMSPPIWMFVFINSFIHALMYTYFTLAAVNVKVPKSIKRGLTTLQIAQFVFGASFAAIHLFVQYDIPIATPYKVLATVSSAAASATSAVASATSTVSEVIETPTAAAAFFNWPTAFKWILRAAGEEGLAERVAIHKSSIHDHMPLAQQSQQIEERMEQATQHALPVGPKYETRWRNQYTKVNCIDTSGEAFAIYLNLFYLFPLTVLFARFFYKAYVKRGTRPQGVSQTAKAIGQDARQAEGETERAIEAAGKRVEDKLRNSGAKGQSKIRDAAKDFHEDLQKVKEGGKFEGRKVSQLIENAEQKFQRTADSIGDATSPASTPKKSPKKKNNNNKKNNQGGSDDSRPSTSQENKKQDGGNDSRPSTSQENKQDSRPSTSQENKKGGDSRPSSSQKNNAAEVHDELKTKVDLKPEGQDAKSNGESSETSKPSEKDGQQESQAPSTPERKQSKNTGSKKESEVDESQGGLFSPLRNEEKSDEKPAAETEKVPTQDESAAKQDANLEASEPTRPAPEDEEEEPESASSSPSASTFIDYAEAVKSGELPESEEEKKDDDEEEESTETASK